MGICHAHYFGVFFDIFFGRFPSPDAHFVFRARLKRPPSPVGNLLISQRISTQILCSIAQNASFPRLRLLVHSREGNMPRACPRNRFSDFRDSVMSLAGIGVRRLGVGTPLGGRTEIRRIGSGRVGIPLGPELPLVAVVPLQMFLGKSIIFHPRRTPLGG